MGLYLFWIRVWYRSIDLELYHYWYGDYYRDRFDGWPCRDCDVPEGMWW
jgi:hypothetical protein